MVCSLKGKRITSWVYCAHLWKDKLYEEDLQGPFRKRTSLLYTTAAVRTTDESYRIIFIEKGAD